MKSSMINESFGAFFPRPFASNGVAEGTSDVARDGLTLTPWSDGLQLWRGALRTLPGASFFHCDSWIAALGNSYSMDLQLATLHREGELRAAAVFARSKGLFATRLVSLPFSDNAGPLAIDEASRIEFLLELATSGRAESIEIRGASGPEPWQNVDCFANWALDMKRPYAEIKSSFSRTVRSGIKRALKDKVAIDRGSGASYISRFFDLQLKTRRRLGIPPQPFRFFVNVHDQFARRGDCEVWFATRNGRDEAGLVLLRDGDQLCCKWAARAENGHSGANHLLVARMLEANAGRVQSADFGRCDMRNQGMVRSKAELGCVSRPLPYAFFPKAPRNVSSEILSGPRKLLSSVWKRLPLPATRVLGEALYRYLA